MRFAPADTSDEAHAVQIALYRRMSGDDRLKLGLRMAEDGRELARAGVRMRHPDYCATQVEDAVRVLYIGTELFKAAWPTRAVPAP